MTTSKHHAIDYIEFGVTDMAAAQAFYAGAFGWSFTAYGDEYAGEQGVESATAEHQHEGHRRKADRRPLPLPRGRERLEGVGQDTIAIRRHVEDLR